MVKSVLGVAHRGLTDWMFQRITAIILAIYIIGMLAYFLCHPHLEYNDWKMLFSENCMRVATILVVLSLLYHAWVGMWTIFTDYIKPFVLRAVLQLGLLVSLFALFFWALQILWGV